MWLTSEIKRFALDSIVPVDSKAVLLECVWFFFFFLFQSGSWYKFNDEDIVKMEGKLKLSQDEDSAG